MNKICIIGVYFGKLPNYFPLWLQSCYNNPAVDFLLFTDNDIAVNNNVTCCPMTLSEMRERASKVLGFEACLNRPYKCCDYKVIYGLIFADYLQQYDYWGHCDFDLIFGDLIAFFDKYNLYKYDHFLALGHLSLYKNTKEVNERYKCTGASADYKTVYSSDKIYVFDEMPGMTAIYLKNGFSIFTKRVFADISPIYYRFTLSQYYYLDKKIKNYKFQTFFCENGKIYREYILNGKLYKEEYLYIHFQKRPNFELTFDPTKTNAFYITNKGFAEKRGETNKKIIKELNAYPGVGVEFFEWLKRKTQQYINAISRRLKRLLGKVK